MAGQKRRAKKVLDDYLRLDTDKIKDILKKMLVHFETSIKELKNLLTNDIFERNEIPHKKRETYRI